ncbi:cytochrome C oxidase subunit II [Mesobacillus harenae]|nr:cytochrome C oxidase subunit II [Mesobacillus harenae]
MEKKVKHIGKAAKEHDSLKGTILSVTVVGAVILVTYLIMYGLYMVRV